MPDYSLAGLDRVLTPALAIYLDAVENNIAFTLELLNGDANRWRPHVKTAKLGAIMHMLVERGAVHFKCATTLELLTACRAGAADVLVAYPLVGANARRVRELAAQFPDVCVSALVDNAGQVRQWQGSRVGLFVDINPGMDRTGMPQAQSEQIVELARVVRDSGLQFRGLHYYDGHLHDADLVLRCRKAHEGYDRLMQIASSVLEADIEVGELITAGTPAFPCSLSYYGFHSKEFVHRVSPGTVVYGDVTSAAQLPDHYRYQPAALVVSRVVSHPCENIVTCDAGHKTVSADAGIPNCEILGRPDLKPLRPSEEHLPIEAPPGAPVPAVGEVIYIVPRHVCPTVNNFDHALLVRGGRIVAVEPVSARGREAPLLESAVSA
ncbi:MAG: D-TA family PLP-dependent enzyme [Acidobacteriia bacterium]|nr:D-TA family PLP-dependent enzyme [Terriglobia bacterium]